MKGINVKVMLMKGMNVKVMLMKCMIHFTHNERYECNGDVNEMYDTFHTR